MSDATTKYRSGQLVSLASLEQPLQVANGEMNLFLIRRGDEGKVTARVFLQSLGAGDVLYVQEEFEHRQAVYALAFVPVGEVCCVPAAAADAADWCGMIHRAACRACHESLPEEEVVLVLRMLVDLLREQKSKHRELVAQHYTQVAHGLDLKLEKLGAMAGVHLQDSVQKEDDGSDELLPALQLIAEIYHLDAGLIESLLHDRDKDLHERISDFVESAGWRARRVELEKDVAAQTARPVLAVREKDQVPVVLYLRGQRSCWCEPARSHEMHPLTDEVVLGLERSAWCFYETFPADVKKRSSLWHFVFQRSRGMLLLILIVGLISSLVSMATPVATEYITGSIIPTGNLPELWQLGLLLLVLTISQIAFGVVPSVLMTIFSSQRYERIQAAIYDHILRIPVNSLRLCDSGDVTQRILSVSEMQSTLFGVVSQQFLSSLFSLVSLALMYWYSPRLALWGTIMVLLYAVVHYFLARLNLHPLRKHAAASGRMSGMLKQFFDGMGKIRAAGAQERVLSRLFDDFGEKVRQNYITDRNAAIREMVAMCFPLIISMGFYGMAGGLWGKGIALPTFMAFMAAFQNFQNGVLGVADGLWSLQAMKPEMDRLRPLLEAEPEDAGHRLPAGKLNGKVEVRNLHFRYAAESPLVLKGVSFQADPGEFVAIVGPSGAGKSSLVRLLLGFEQPESGAVYFSDKDLSHLDLRGVRRQMGVILQNSRLMPGSILENIIMGTEYTVEDAWMALYLAAFAEEVEAMPMGIYTMVNPESVSGGQQQRILLARALVGRPSLLIMDESTSALDNFAQDTIRKNLEQLQVTRIAIAHRLSTIAHADRIYVMDQGKVVQVGTYAELAAQPGVFRRLIERQIS